MGKTEKPPLVYWKIHTTNEQTTTENRIKTLDEFISWANNFKEGEFVFRGVPNEAYKIQASAYRRPVESEMDFEKFLNINKDLIRAARQRGYDRKDGTEWSDLEILVELQHYGAATCLIDFSYSAQIALWFACRDFQKKDENGESQNINKPPHGKVSVIQMKRSKFTEITPDFMKKGAEKTIDYFLKEPKDSPLYYLKPMFQNNRIISQQSVLLFGNYELDADDECIIEEGCKSKILTELERTSGYTEDRLFPDFEGFAWVNREAAPYTELTPSALKEQGNRAFENEEYDAAIGDFSRAIDRDSNDVEAYNLRGRAYTRLEDFDNALADFAEAEKIDPDDAETYFNRGILHRNQEEYNDAIIDFDKTINLQSDHAEAFYFLGQAKYNLRQYRAAEADFAQATNLNPNYGEAFFHRGISKYNFQQYEESLEHFNEAIRLKYENARAYLLRGVVKNRLGRYNLAIDDFNLAIDNFNRSINLDDTLILSYRERGIARYNLNQSSEARSDLEKALELAKQQENEEMIATINSLLQEFFGHNTSEEDDE